jgi:hypothetical protein
MGEWFIPNAVRCSCGLEEAERKLIKLLLLFNKHNRDHLQIQTVKYPDFPSAMRPVPLCVQLPVPNPLENLTFRDDNSDSDEYHRWQEGDNLDCDDI